MSNSLRPPSDDDSQNGSAQAASTPTPAKNISPFHRVFAPHALVWSEATRLARRKDIKVKDLAFCVLQDPVIVLELLKRANALYFSAGRPPITNAATAITRLGSEVVISLLDELLEREPVEDLEVRKIFEFHRNRCKRAGIISHMLAEVISRPIAEECHTAGIFIFLGDMLAAHHFGPKYVALYESLNFITLQCKLTQDHKFDPEKMGLTYLQKAGVPELVLAAVDRNATSKHPERSMMRPICFAAAEMIDAFDNEKWDKLAPGRQLPPKSALRFLQITGNTFLKLYERASEYLYLDKATQDRTSIEDLGRPVAPPPEEPPISFTAPTPEVGEESAGDFALDLESDLQALLDSVPPPLPTAIPRVAPPQRKAPPGQAADSNSLNPSKAKEIIQRSYDLGPKDPHEMGARKRTSAPLVSPPPLRTSNGNAFVGSVTTQIEQAKKSEDLLRDILGILIEEGPFEKSAIIVVSKDRKTAIVIAARGPQIAMGQQILLDDPLSPLAQCFSKVQSFGNRAHPESPWGSKAFALAPIDANHETPVALYADCGLKGSLTFEARRVFRVVVDLLNQKLPSIPGGLPVEI